MMVYICTKFQENILNGKIVMEWTDGGHDIIRPVFDGRIKMDDCMISGFKALSTVF